MKKSLYRIITSVIFFGALLALSSAQHGKHGFKEIQEETPTAPMVQPMVKEVDPNDKPLVQIPVYDRTTNQTTYNYYTVSTTPSGRGHRGAVINYTKLTNIATRAAMHGAHEVENHTDAKANQIKNVIIKDVDDQAVAAQQDRNHQSDKTANQTNRHTDKTFKGLVEHIDHKVEMLCIVGAFFAVFTVVVTVAVLSRRN